MTNIGKIRKSNGSIIHTFATTFLLPTIGYCEKEFKNNLINVYIDEDLSEPKLLLVIDYLPNIEESMSRLKTNAIYIGHEISECNTEVIIKFKIPDRYLNIFDKFIKGKYSEFDKAYKQILTNMYGIKVNPNGKLVTVQDIIYPRSEKRLQIAKELNVELNTIPSEVFDVPDLSYEIYKPIKQLTDQIELYGEERNEC